MLSTSSIFSEHGTANGGLLDGGLFQQKEVPPKVEGFENPEVIHPTLPVVFKVITSGSTPETVVLFLDMDRTEINFTCRVSRSEYIASSGAKGLVDLDEGNSSISYDSSTKKWTFAFAFVFSWQFDGDKTFSIGCEVVDPFGLEDRNYKGFAYRFEKDIEVDGEPRIIAQDEGTWSPDGYYKGGSFMVFEGACVHFEDDPSASPDPSTIRMGLEDENGWVWEYWPKMREQLSIISFSFPLPKVDGPDGFVFRVFSVPSGVKNHGSLGFDLIIDSTSPALGDPRYFLSDGRVDFSWAFSESGAGIDLSSLRYSILDARGNLVRAESTPENPWISGDRLGFSFPTSEEEDLEIVLALADRVSNPIQGDASFMFTTRTKPVHDLALDKDLVMSPDIIIEGQTIQVRSRIVNRGSMDEEDVVLAVKVDGVHYQNIRIESVPAGSSRDQWWTWIASDHRTKLEVEVDPLVTIQDEDRSNNVHAFELDPQYLDIYPDKGYLSSFDPVAGPFETVNLSYRVSCLGTIGAGDFKALFLQDQKFMGYFQMDPMTPDQDTILTIPWKIDPSAVNLTIVIDPFNEVLETVENNNRFDRTNPYYEPVKGAPPAEGVQGPDEGPVDINEPSEEGLRESGPTGGTTWEGPVEDIPSSNGPTNIIGPTPESPETSDFPLIPPYVLPTVIATITFSLFGLLAFAAKFEPARYKLALVLFPLYSKIKKEKVEMGTRYEILGYLKAKPGANYSELKEILDLNDGSLVHHLRVLEREEKIYSKKLGKYKLFYVSSYRRQSAVEAYISPLHKRILEIISKNPGIVPKKLSLILDRSQTDISYHLGELTHHGFLEKRKKGRNIHYYITLELESLV